MNGIHLMNVGSFPSMGTARRREREAQVDLVVRDVDIAFRGDDVELVDLTAALVEIFDPSAETLRVIEELSKHPPVPLESFPIEHDAHDRPEDGGKAEPAPAGAVDEASAAAREWLALIDAGTFEKSCEGASEHFRAVVPRESWLQSMSTLRGSTGKVLSREVDSARYTTRVPDGPAGAYVLFRFRTAFEGGRKVTETVSMVREVRGVWAADGYYIR